ncbi:MAG: transcription antitermination factor NusB [Selenomonadales bacterium]|jgi:N utilization substance protein B|nr:transcription antitermination factor NusB [Selenomonadales bacterium]MDY3739526.1 transcription antitermination factor NusB [Selenomonadaceae bacterium]MEE1362832.1 transcription antitermination factor NusB [Selenomonadaceae bacterium]
MSRRQARELVVQALFHLDFNSMEEVGNEADGQAMALDMAVEEFAAELSPQEQKEQFSKKDKAFADALLQGARENIEKIDEILSQNSKDWKVSRMASIDRNILRLAIYELFFAPEKLQPGIIINEAVELAKKYGTDDSGRFVNGILGSLSK